MLEDCNFIKNRDSSTGFFSVNLAKFEHLFYRTPLVAVSVVSGEMKCFRFGVR